MAFKKRIRVILTEYLKNGETVKTTRLVPARMQELIKRSKAKLMSVRVIYKKDIENETVESDDKNYLLKTLSIFTRQKLIKEALTY